MATSAMATKAVVVRRRPVPRAFTRAFRPRGKKQFTVSLLVVAGMLPAVTSTYNEFRFNGPTKAGQHFTKIMTGYSPSENTFRFREMKAGALPMVLGIVGHKIASRLGVNRLLANAGIPFIRI